MTQMPTYFVSHGGGPWPWIETMRAEMASFASWSDAVGYVYFAFDADDAA